MVFKLFFYQEMHCTKESYLRVQMQVKLLRIGDEDENKGLQLSLLRPSFPSPRTVWN